MKLEDYDLIPPQVRSLVSLHMVDDPELLSDVMTYPRTGLSDDDKLEYVVNMLMYCARMSTQLLRFACETTGSQDPVEVWRSFCALRS